MAGAHKSASAVNDTTNIRVLSRRGTKHTAGLKSNIYTWALSNSRTSQLTHNESTQTSNVHAKDGSSQSLFPSMGLTAKTKLC